MYKTRMLERLLYFIGQCLPGYRYRWPTRAADVLWQRRMQWLDDHGLLEHEGE
jgi:hypothetical protein